MQSLSSAAMVANVLQALNDDSDNLSTTSPDSNLSLDSIEGSPMSNSDSNDSDVGASKMGNDVKVALPEAVFSGVDSGSEKRPTNDAASGETVNVSPAEGGDYGSLEKPSAAGEGAVAPAVSEASISDCEIDTELTSKEKTKQWLSSPDVFLWKKERKVRAAEVSVQKCDQNSGLSHDSLSNSPIESPASPRLDIATIQDEVEDLANLFTKLKTGSSKSTPLVRGDDTDRKRQTKDKSRQHRASLRLPKPRSSSSSSLGHVPVMAKRRSSMQRSSGSLDLGSSRSPSQRSSRLLDVTASCGSLGNLSSGLISRRSDNSLLPSSMDSSKQTSSSNIADHLMSSVSDTERRITDLIGPGDGDITKSDTSLDLKAKDPQLGKQDGTKEARGLVHPLERKNLPKFGVNAKTDERPHLKQPVIYHTSKSSFDKDSLEKTVMAADESTIETTTTDGSTTTVSSCMLDSRDSRYLTEKGTSASENESVSRSFDTFSESTCTDSDSLNRNVQLKQMAELKRGMIIGQRELLLASKAWSETETCTTDSQAQTPSSISMDATESTRTATRSLLREKTEFDSDGTCTDGSEYRSSGTDHVADSEHEDSDNPRYGNSKDGVKESNRRSKEMNPGSDSGLLCLLDVQVSGYCDNTGATPAETDEKGNTTMNPKHSMVSSGMGKEQAGSETFKVTTRPIEEVETSNKPTNAEENIERKAHLPPSDEQLSQLEDIDPDSLTEEEPSVSLTSTNQRLTRSDEHPIRDNIAFDFNHLMAQASKRKNTSEGNIPPFVSPHQSGIITRSDMNAEFRASSELDKLRSPQASVTQLSHVSESVDATEEFRSTVESTDVDDEGFVTPDEERSLSPDVENWIFDVDESDMAGVINELNIGDFVDRESRSATPLVSLLSGDADSLGSDFLDAELMSPSSIGATSTHSPFAKLAHYQTEVQGAETAACLDSEPDNQTAPEPHPHTPVEEQTDKELEVTTSDDQDSAGEHSPGRATQDVSNSQNDPSALRTSSSFGERCRLLSLVKFDGSDDSRGNSPDTHPEHTTSLIQRASPGDVLKQEQVVTLSDFDLINCSSLSGSLSGQLRSCNEGEVSSSEDETPLQPDNARTNDDLQHEIANVIGPVLGTVPTTRHDHNSAMSDVLKLAFSRSLQTAITGSIVEDKIEREIESPAGNDSKESNLNSDKVFGPRVSQPKAQIGDTWSKPVEEGADPVASLSTVMELDETTHSLSSKSSKSSEIDVSETDSDKSAGTKRRMLGAWDADVSSQSESECASSKVTTRSDFVSSSKKIPTKVAILGQSECSFQDNMYQDSASDRAKPIQNFKFGLHSNDTSSTMPALLEDISAPFSGIVNECCDNLGAITDLGSTAQLCVDVGAQPTIRPLSPTKRETNISRPSASNTLWKLPRPPSVLTVVAEDAIGERPDIVTAEEFHDSCSTASFVQSESVSDSGTLADRASALQTEPPSSFRHDSDMGTISTVYPSASPVQSVEQLTVTLPSSVEQMTVTLPSTVQSCEQIGEGSVGSSSVVIQALERKRIPSPSLPFPKRSAMVNADSIQKDVVSVKVNADSSLEVSPASSETMQTIEVKSNDRSPSSTWTKLSNTLISTASKKLSNSVSVTKKPTTLNGKPVVKCWVTKKMDDPCTSSRTRLRRESKGSTASVSGSTRTRTRIPSAVSQRPVDHNVRAKIDTALSYCLPRTRASSLKNARDASSAKRSRSPGKPLSARSTSKLKTSKPKTKSIPKRLSKSVDCLDTVVRSSKRGGHAASESRTPIAGSSKADSQEVVQTENENDLKCQITVKIPGDDITPVTTCSLKDVDNVESNSRKEQENDATSVDADSIEKSVELANTTLVVEAISVQAESQPKSVHKKKHRRMTGSPARDNEDAADDVEIYLPPPCTTYSTDSISERSTPRKEQATKLEKMSVAKPGKKIPRKRSVSAVQPTRPPFRTTFFKSNDDSPGRLTDKRSCSESPSRGPRSKKSSPRRASPKRVHCKTETKSGIKKGQLIMKATSANHPHSVAWSFKDEPGLVVVGEEVVVEPSPSDNAMSTCTASDVVLEPTTIAEKAPSFIVSKDPTSSKKKKKKKKRSTKNLLKQSDSAEAKPAVAPLPKEIGPVAVPRKKSATNIILAKLSGEIRYSDGKIRRDNTKESLQCRDPLPSTEPLQTMSADRCMKTKIPCLKKAENHIKASLPDIAAIQCGNKLPQQLTKAISDMVISKTDSLTEDIVRQLCNTMLGKESSGTRVQLPNKPTTENIVPPEGSSTKAENVGHLESEMNAHSDVKHKTALTPCHVSQHDSGSTSPASSSEPLTLSSNSCALDATASHQPSSAQAGKIPVRQRSLTQSLTCCHSLPSHSSKSPIRRRALTQSTKSPAHRLSVSESGRSLLRTSFDMNDGSSSGSSSRKTLAGSETSARSITMPHHTWSERIQSLKDSCKRSGVDAGSQDIVPSAGHGKCNDSSSPKTSPCRTKKPHSALNTGIACSKPMNFNDTKHSHAENEFDWASCVSQRDIATILKRFNKTHAEKASSDIAQEGEGARSSVSRDSVTPDGMSDDKALESTLVTAVSVIIQTREMVLQQLFTKEHETSGTVTTDGITTTKHCPTGQDKQDLDDSVVNPSSAAVASHLHLMKKDALNLLKDVRRTSNDILNYMSADQVDVTECLLKQLQLEGLKDDSAASSNTSLYPSKAEPMSWMSLNDTDDTSEKHSPRSPDESINERSHTFEIREKSHSLPTNEIREKSNGSHTNEIREKSVSSPDQSPRSKSEPVVSQQALVKKLMNISHRSVHVGGDKSGSYISTLHKKTTLRKLMDMRNPRTQVKKLVQKKSSEDDASLTKRDIELLKQSPWRKSRKQAATDNQNPGWRSNWDDVAIIDPLPVIKKRSCSGASSNRTSIPALKRRSSSVVASSSKTDMADATKMEEGSVTAKTPLCVDMKLLLADAIMEGPSSPGSSVTDSPLPTAEKKILLSDSESDRPRQAALSPYECGNSVTVPLPSDRLSSVSSETSRSYISAERQASVIDRSEYTSVVSSQSIAIEKKETDSRYLQSLERRDLVHAGGRSDYVNQNQAVETGDFVSTNGKDLVPKQQLSSDGSVDLSTATMQGVPELPKKLSDMSFGSISVTSSKLTSATHLENIRAASAAVGRRSASNSCERSHARRRGKLPKRYASAHSESSKSQFSNEHASSGDASPRNTRDNSVRNHDHVDHQLISKKTEVSSNSDDATLMQETRSGKTGISRRLSLSTLPRLAIDIGAAAMDMLLPSFKNSASSVAGKATVSAANQNIDVKSAPSAKIDIDDEPPVIMSSRSDRKKSSTKERKERKDRKQSSPRSSKGHPDSGTKSKSQTSPSLRGLKPSPHKDRSASKKATPLHENQTLKHQHVSPRHHKHVAKTNDPKTTQLRRTSSTTSSTKKQLSPQSKRHRKAAAVPAKTLKLAKKVLSLDGKLALLKDMLHTEFGSSCESIGTMSSSKDSTMSLVSSTDDASLSEISTDRSTVESTMVTDARDQPIQEPRLRYQSGGNHDRGEPNPMTTDPAFAWQRQATPSNDIQSPMSCSEEAIRQYMQSYYYAASSDIVQSLSELETMISDLSFLVDSKNLPEGNSRRYAEESFQDHVTVPNGNAVDSFFDIASFASNLASSFEEISSTASATDPTHNSPLKDNMRAKALLNNTRLGNIYLRQMTAGVDNAKVDECTSDELSDDQVITTDRSYSSTSGTSTSPSESVVPQSAHLEFLRSLENKRSSGAMQDVVGESSTEVDAPSKRPSDSDSGCNSNGEAPVTPVVSDHEQVTASDSAQSVFMDESMYTTASEIDLMDSMSFFSDDEDDLVTVVGLPRDGDHTPEESDLSGQSSLDSSDGEMGKWKSTTGFDKQLPSCPLIEQYQSLELDELRQSRSNLVECCSSVPDTKSIYALQDSCESNSYATRSTPELVTPDVNTKQLSSDDLFDLFFTYLGPEKAHAYFDRSESCSPNINTQDSVKNSCMESMCPSRGSSSSNDTSQSSDLDIPDGSHVSYFSRPSSHMSPVSMMPSDSLLTRDVTPGDRVGLPSAELLKKIELFYNQEMNGSGNDLELTQFMGRLYSGVNSTSPAERALHCALRCFQSRTPRDAQPPSELNFPVSATDKYPNKEELVLSDQDRIRGLRYRRRTGSSSDHSFYQKLDGRETMSLTPSDEVMLKRTSLTKQQVRSVPVRSSPNIIEALEKQFRY